MAHLRHRLGLPLFLIGANAWAGQVNKIDDRPLIREELKDDESRARALREYYTKHEYRIAMRDGVRLFTVVYTPKDSSRPYPILMARTPYAVPPYGVDNYANEKNVRALRVATVSAQLERDGYIFVLQDVRGRAASEGTFVDIRPIATTKDGTDESTDAYDTIDFLVKNVSNNNGRVGVWGISYPGFYAAQAAINAHPALKAVSPQAPVTEWFLGDDFHHNGALFLQDAFDFYSNFGRPRPKPTKKKGEWTSLHDGIDAYDFFLDLGPVSQANVKYLNNDVNFWNDLMTHGNRDAFWKARDPRPHYRDTKPAVMTVGGWFDAEDCFGALATYRAFETQNARGGSTLVMGPWQHGGWLRSDGDRVGNITFGAKTSNFYRESIELAFYRKHLKQQGTSNAPEAAIFETGTNEWRNYDAWPPKSAKPTHVFFHAAGKLSTAPLGKGETGADSYVSDPAKPVPHTAKLVDGDATFMVEDQRFAARRPDVLVYATPELESDVTVSGPIEANLWVTTTGTDADFIVKVIDVYPDEATNSDPAAGKLSGYQQLVRGEVMRGKFRSSFEAPSPFKPGEPTLVHFTLPDVAHTFRTGHKLMVQVQSTWFPLVDRNPQTFVDIYRANAGDFRAATHTLLRVFDKPSSIRLMMTKGRLP